MTKKRNHGEDKSGIGRQTGSVSIGGSGLPTPKQELIALEEATPLNEITDTTSQRSQPRGKGVEKAPIVSKPTAEMREIATTLDAMAINMELLAKMVETIESQASLLTTNHASAKIQEEIKVVQKQLDEQRDKERTEAKGKRDWLKTLTEEPPNESMREKWNAKIRDVIRDDVSSRVEEELGRQITLRLKNQAREHSVQMHRIDNDLYNAEQRRRNAHVREKEPLHRLRIPAMSRSSSGSTATPSTALLTPQPNLLLCTDVGMSVEENVSPVFPKNVEELYHYCKSDKGKLRQLLQDYGEDTPDESAYQFNKVLHLIGVGTRFHAVDPPAAPQKPLAGRSQRGVQNIDAMPLSPLMIASS